MSAEKNTYGHILRSASIIAGAQAGNYVIGLVRVKLIAMLLGPAGVGLVGLYASLMDFIGSLSNLGLAPSGVREIVRAANQQNPEETVARTAKILSRACLVTGCVGWAATVLLREPISLATTGTAQHAAAIGWLGSMALFSAVTAGQLALLQGLQRIGDLARANIIGALVGSIATVTIYWGLGENGIILAMIANTLILLIISYLYSRRITVAPVTLSWRETWRGFTTIIRLGVAFMWVAVLNAALDMLVRSYLIQKFNVDAAGLYQAAWALSGVFAAFVLTAMGTDFYPRLTSIIHDHALARRAVNEQTEIGVLLALPGLLALLAFSPLVIRFLYTEKFLAAADLLPYFGLGVFGRVVSWPMGFIQLASGASRWYATTETVFRLFQALLMFSLAQHFGLVGVAYAVPINYALYTVGMLLLSRRLIGFTWSAGTWRLILTAGVFVTAAFLARFISNQSISLIFSAALTAAGTLFSLRALIQRLGGDSRLTRWLSLCPGGKYLLRKNGEVSEGYRGSHATDS